MSETCEHVWRVSDWTRDPETGRWVHADPECMKPSPFAIPSEPRPRRRVLRDSTAPTR